MATTTTDLRSGVDDVTQCSICLANFNKPRILPCVHTFCLNCLSDWFKSYAPGSQASCPVCKKQFQIPDGGISDLPHDFRMEKLVDMLKLPGDVCSAHKNKPLELYCFRCKTSVCLVCHAVAHQQHSCQEIDKVAESFKPQIDKDAQRAFSRINDIRKQVAALDAEKNTFDQRQNKLEETIKQQGDTVKQLIDSQVNKLLQEVKSVNFQTDKEIKSRKEKLQSHITDLERFHTNLLKLKNEGKPSYVIRAAKELHVTADELLQKCVKSDNYRAPDFEFSPTESDVAASAKKSNMVGSFQDKKYTAVSRAPLCRPKTEAVRGVTVSQDELNVRRVEPEKDVNNYTPKQQYQSVKGSTYLQYGSTATHTTNPFLQWSVSERRTGLIY